MAEDKPTLSPNAQKVLLWQYALLKGIPETFRGKVDPCAVQMAFFQEITGLTEFEVAAAYAEAEDAGMIERRK
jgi:hypothetical protein